MNDDHDLVADIDSDTLISIVKFFNQGKAPGTDNTHNEVLRLGTTTHMTQLQYPILKEISVEFCNGTMKS